MSLYRFYSGEFDNTDIQHCIDNGGIINLFDHWWDMFKGDSAGNLSNYQIVDYTLDHIENNYGDKVWWPFGSELALWLHYKKYADHSWQYNKNSVTLSSDVPAWNPDWREINISYTINLPKNKRVTQVEFSKNGINWLKLDATKYWQEGPFFYLNVPFRGNTTTILRFSD